VNQAQAANTPVGAEMPPQKNLQSRLKISLDSLDSRLYKPIMPRMQDVMYALRAQWAEDEKALETALDEQNKLRASYIRFVDLQEQVKQRTERMRRVGALLLGSDHTQRSDVEAMQKAAAQLGIDVNEWDAVFEGIPLWSTIAEILRHTGELQVVDLHTILHNCGEKVSRQAIESALETHASAFKIRRKGREKFVSLK